MTGDLARLDAICELKDRYDARLMIDDAHGFGVMGPRGRGTAEHFGVTDRVDVYFGTFAKAFASIGGVSAAPEDVVGLDQVQRALPGLRQSPADGLREEPPEDPGARPGRGGASRAALRGRPAPLRGAQGPGIPRRRGGVAHRARLRRRAEETPAWRWTGYASSATRRSSSRASCIP